MQDIFIQDRHENGCLSILSYFLDWRIQKSPFSFFGLVRLSIFFKISSLEKLEGLHFWGLKRASNWDFWGLPLLEFWFQIWFWSSSLVKVSFDSNMSDAAPLNVCVTGAAGQIAYSLIYIVAKGEVFGANQRINLLLLDIPPMMPVLGGVVMEIQDCAFPLVNG